MRFWRSCAFVGLAFVLSCGRLGYLPPGNDGQPTIDLGLDVGTGDATPVDVDAGSPFTIETVATGMTNADALAADDNFIYWAARGQIWRLSKDGGAPTSLFMSGFTAQSIVVDTTQVYWADDMSRFVYRGPKAGGGPMPLAISIGSPKELAVDATHVYWPSDGFSSAALERIRLVGGPSSPERLVQAGQPDYVAVDASYIYWASANGDPNINRINKATMAADVLLMVGAVRDLMVQGSELYFATPTSVNSMPSRGGPPTTLASGETNIGHISVGDNYVAWTNSVADGNVRRVAKGGGPIEVIAAGQDRPRSLLADGNVIYWVTGNTVYRVVF